MPRVPVDMADRVLALPDPVPVASRPDRVAGHRVRKVAAREVPAVAISVPMRRQRTSASKRGRTPIEDPVVQLRSVR